MFFILRFNSPHAKHASHDNGMWLSLVERRVRDAETGGSNPLIPTRQIKGL